MMRKSFRMSLDSCKQLKEYSFVPSKIDFFQLTDSDIQSDFIEVWMNIKESIKKVELTFEKKRMNKKSGNKISIINLNLEL